MRDAENSIGQVRGRVRTKLVSAFTGAVLCGAVAVTSGTASAQELDAAQIAAIQGQVNAALIAADTQSFNAAQFDPVALCNCVEPLPPPPPVRSFIVFFEWDQSDLTIQAQQVVADAVAEVERNGAARIQVVGHTDTSHYLPGTEASQIYNQALSERRAESVKAEMVRLGIAADEIVTEGRSFNDLLIETGDGVREPQNRRATIDLGEFTLQLAATTHCDAPELVQALADLNDSLVAAYGSQAAPEIGSIILASATSAGIPEEAIGAGLGRSAMTIGETDRDGAILIAQVIANEGTGAIANSFAGSVCNPALAAIALAPPAAVAAGPEPITAGGNPTPTVIPILAASAS
jgi:outer membrane protein OmpA-like peptidoglycan-associated protein